MPLPFLEEVAASPSRRFRLCVVAFLLGLALSGQPLVLAVLCTTAFLLAARVPRARRLLAIGVALLLLGAARPQFRPLLLPMPVEALGRARERTAFLVRRAMPGPEGQLILGITVGEKGGMARETVRRFRATGTTHLVAVSGANLTIAAGALMPLLFFLGMGRRAVAAATAVGVAAFAGFTGAEPPVVRAACMALLVLVARETGRTPDRANVLLAAAAAMLAAEPRLIGSISFALSMTATGGLLWLSPHIAAALPQRLPEFVRGATADGVGATLATLPITVGTFGEFSAAALPANVVAAPFVPLLTIGGGVLIAASWLWDAAGLVLGTALAAPTALLLSLLGLFARAPGSLLTGGGFPGWLAALWYMALWALARRAAKPYPLRNTTT